MRFRVLAVLLLGAAALGGCSEGVLNPKGPVADAERQILFNSLGIMLAIVIPTILATPASAFLRSCSRKSSARSLLILSPTERPSAFVTRCPTPTVGYPATSR